MASDPKHLRNVPPPNGSKAQSYSRFIPREELDGFAAWQPGSLSGQGGKPTRGVHREPPAPPAPAPAPAAPAAPTAAEIEAQVRAARSAGYQDGYRDGLVALDGFKQTYASQITAEVGVLVGAIGQQVDDLHQDMARALALTAASLARQIVRSELATRPELIARVAEEAIDTLGQGARHLTLRVHPQDQGLVAQGAVALIDSGRVRLVADTGIGRGGCLLESDAGVVDATLEERWQRAAAAIGCDTPWAPPADDAADADADADADAEAEAADAAMPGGDTEAAA